ERFVEASRGCENIDLAFGRSGFLLGCAILLEALPGHLDPSTLRSFGDSLLDSIVSDLRLRPPLGESTDELLGTSHGWSGFLFAVLRWCEASDTPPPDGIRGRLEELAALGQLYGRGLRWPRHAGASIDDSSLTASWCNGAAGH